MTTMYPIDEAQARLPDLFAEAADHLVCVRDGDRVLGYLVAPQQVEDWEAQVETMEILANPEAMRALESARSGQAAYQTLQALDD